MLIATFNSDVVYLISNTSSLLIRPHNETGWNTIPPTTSEFSFANSEHGGANPMDLIDNVHQIRNARNNADHVLLIVHGGHEYNHYPCPETLKRYRFYAEMASRSSIV